MMLSIRRNKPGLLVSVRSASEAITALAGGADVIDVKEPARGALGAADFETLDEIVKVVRGQAIVTAAMGELADWLDAADNVSSASIPNGISLFKLGLAELGLNPRWQHDWRRVVIQL